MNYNIELKHQEKDNQLTICSQTQTEKCRLLIAVRQSIEEQVVKRLSQIRSLKIE